MLNVFSDVFSQKSARNRGHVLNMLPCVEHCFGGGGTAKNTQTFNIFDISLVLSIFRQKTFNISPVSWTQVHETGEMLNVFCQKRSKQGKC